MCACLRPLVFAFTHECMHVCLRACLCACVRACMHACVFACLCACARAIGCGALRTCALACGLARAPAREGGQGRSGTDEQRAASACRALRRRCRGRGACARAEGRGRAARLHVTQRPRRRVSVADEPRPCAPPREARSGSRLRASAGRAHHASHHSVPAAVRAVPMSLARSL